MLKDHLHTAWTHIRRTPHQALAAVGIIALTFLVASIFVLLAAGSTKVIQFFETRPQVTAFFSDEATEDQVEDLISRLEATGKTSGLKYISKEEALEIYQAQNQDDPLLLEMVTASILPASLEVSTRDLSYLGDIAAILDQEKNVEEVIFQQDVVEALRLWTLNLRRVGLAVIASLGLVSFLIIMVIISMKVALRRQEIEILQILGAGAWYVRAPFVIEGAIYGFFGALLAWGLTVVLLLYATPFLVEFLANLPLLPVPPVFLAAMLGGGLLAGVLLGIFSSLVAAKRYWR